MERVETYSNDDVVTFARVWTGFDRDTNRGNQQLDNRRTPNRMDPMVIKPTWRDVMPKAKLKRNGYLGDGYPVCSELPERHFLKKVSQRTPRASLCPLALFLFGCCNL